jgi:hypothetical protein
VAVTDLAKIDDIFEHVSNVIADAALHARENTIKRTTSDSYCG